MKQKFAITTHLPTRRTFNNRGKNLPSSNSEVNNAWLFHGTISSVKFMGHQIRYEMNVNAKSGGMWEEAVVEYFKARSQYFLAGTEITEALWITINVTHPESHPMPSKFESNSYCCANSVGRECMDIRLSVLPSWHNVLVRFYVSRHDWCQLNAE
jgi:hypothetical protein